MIEKYEINKFLNPAFSGFLIAHFLRVFSKKNINGIEPVYILFVLPFCIHPEFRYLLNESSIKNIILLIEKNKDKFNSFDKVMNYFLPYTYEGLYFLTKAKVIKVVDNKIVLNSRYFKPNEYSKYIKNEVKAAKKLASLLANKFDILTILKSLGVEL
ncbi:hypothetical protein KPE82_11960 [Acinetobacter baumannii]|uniref:three component ABC system middle component n=1 Tax=Acinetobacter baumannii TaxID=470 RepID=UPI001C0BADCA|nr:three component ABC system middle component [Acinetobacter baumannii]MBU3096317.1 hypothetical protein [Acinetobacter baumannii]MCS6738594.1 DUF6521 family protein [Acinetobacter baumannii]MDC5342114.1 DUF6521 family protein [Acinetobacter baumannii]